MDKGLIVMIPGSIGGDVVSWWRVAAGHYRAHIPGGLEEHFRAEVRRTGRRLWRYQVWAIRGYYSGAEPSLEAAREVTIAILNSARKGQPRHQPTAPEPFPEW